MDQQLVEKYDVPVPRYTSYPTVPKWQVNDFSVDRWKKNITMTNLGSEGLSLYIHLPYCESLCTYCGCNKRITVNHSVELSYVQALIKEWYMYLSLFNETPTIREIHLGGGTPTFFSPQHLALLIESLLKPVKRHPEYEFSFEGHPNNTTFAHLKTLFDLGFRRVSFGIQDFDLKVQEVINRIQPVTNVHQVTQWAREIGYNSVNFDLIYGLPFQTAEGIRKTMTEVKGLKPDRIAFYSYAHVPWTSPGQRAYDEKDLPSGDEKRRLNQLGQTLLNELGYVSIGMDHFALPSDPLTMALNQGRLKRNFMGYTESNGSGILGLGVSSISDLSFGYAQNVKSVEGYLSKIQKEELPLFKGHFNTPREIHTKSLIMKIACTRNIPVEALAGLDKEARAKFDSMVSEGLIERICADFHVTEKGTQFLRNICSLFDEYYHQGQGARVFSKAV